MSQHKEAYIISYHEALRHDMSNVVTIAEFLDVRVYVCVRTHARVCTHACMCVCIHMKH